MQICKLMFTYLNIIIQGLHVLPRQTCGLYTHTLFYDKFPNGPDRLEASIYGGELYQQVRIHYIYAFKHLS